MNGKPTLPQKPLPKWFDGRIYDKGATVVNPYTGDKTELSPEELSMYDFIKGAEFVMGTMGHRAKLVNEMRKGLDWFRHANPEAYMILLD